MSKIIIGSLCTVVALGSLGLLIFVIKSLRGVDGESTEQLQAQIDKSKDGDKKYVQLIETSDYHTAGLGDLFNSYSKLGQTTIDSLSGGSEKTKAFLLRTVGRNLKSQEGLFTTQLKTLSGEILKLDDGKDHILFFADDSEYSATVLGLLHERAKSSDQDKKLNYTIVFPTLDGTKIDQFFKANSSRIGTIEENSVVSIDSQPNQANLSIYSIATQEYHVTDLPSYVAIDKTGVVSLAGVGTIIDSEQKLTDWLNSAFYTKNKLYNEIEKGVDKDKKGASPESSTSSSSETKKEGSETTPTASGTGGQ